MLELLNPFYPCNYAWIISCVGVCLQNCISPMFCFGGMRFPHSIYSHILWFVFLWITLIGLEVTGLLREFFLSKADSGVGAGRKCLQIDMWITCEIRRTGEEIWVGRVKCVSLHAVPKILSQAGQEFLSPSWLSGKTQHLAGVGLYLLSESCL